LHRWTSAQAVFFEQQQRPMKHPTRKTSAPVVPTFLPPKMPYGGFPQYGSSGWDELHSAAPGRPRSLVPAPASKAIFAFSAASIFRLVFFVIIRSVYQTERPISN
jgi:hypothetical protein